MYRKLSAILSSALLLLLSVALIAAQSNCSALFDEAIEAIDDNCGDTGRNEACYGFDQVEASFLTNIDESTFTQPQDIAAVADIATIRTAPLNTSTGTWGVAIMNIQANLPDTLPGQSVTFVLMGDVEVENAVAPEDAFDPNDGIDVTVNIPAGANIRSGPGLNFNVIGGATDAAVLLADGLSEDTECLRVIYRDRPAWISRSTINEIDGIADLPTLTADLVTPMQAIYLRTGVGQPECEDVPDDLLLVQGPEDIEIAININGAEINLGSSGAIRVIMIDGEPYLEIIVFDGQFTTGGQTIRAGQRSVMCLGNEDSRGLDGEANDLIVNCGASEPETVDLDEFGEEWCVMEDVPDNILNYGLEVLCPGETPPTPEPPANTGGETGTTSELTEVDCSSFTILTQSIVATDFVLSWTEAPGATEYHVAVFDSGGTEISTITGITGTSVGVNGGVGFAGSGSVHVRAFRNGEYACVATLGYASRAPDPNEPVGGYGGEEFNVTLGTCYEYGGGDSYGADISWTNSDGAVTVTAGGFSATYSGVNGSASPENYDISYGFSVTSDGITFNFTCSSYEDV